MRREKNQYIFASELTKRQRSHRFRNAILLLLPILIVTCWVLNITVSRRIRVEDVTISGAEGESLIASGYKDLQVEKLNEA